MLAAPSCAPARPGVVASVFLSGLVGRGVLGTRPQPPPILAGLEERAGRLERERDRRSPGRAAERTRIAREMHDIVAHNLSVMVALATAPAATPRAPEQAAGRAMDRHRADRPPGAGRDAALLGVLRDDRRPELAPQPGIRQIDELRGAGARRRPAR